MVFYCILIPIIWPAYAIFTGHLNEWIDGIFLQASRESGKDVRIRLISFFKLMLFSYAWFCRIYLFSPKNGFFIFLWVVPFLIFISTFGFVINFI